MARATDDRRETRFVNISTSIAGATRPSFRKCSARLVEHTKMARKNRLCMFPHVLLQRRLFGSENERKLIKYIDSTTRLFMTGSYDSNFWKFSLSAFLLPYVVGTLCTRMVVFQSV